MDKKDKLEMMDRKDNHLQVQEDATKENMKCKTASESGKGKRGGARTGAGRPQSTSKLYAFRADQEVAAAIDGEENKTEFIRKCILREMQTRSAGQQLLQLDKLGIAIPAGRVKPQTVPFFDMKIVAGFPIPLNNDEMAQSIELLQMLCPHTDSCYLIRVQGNSMIDAGVNDGDILIVDKSLREPTEKQIAVCELNGEYTVKRVQLKSDGSRWLVPANPDYKPISISDGDTFNVWGVVTFIIHRPV